MNRKKGYFNPDLEIVLFEESDMICTSGEQPIDPENYGVGVAWKDAWNTVGGNA